MQRILKSPAKVNLSLDILGRAPNGYHFMQSVMQEIYVPCDGIVIEESTDFRLTCSDPRIPLDEKNSIIRAVYFLEKTFGVEVKCTIHLQKNIPPQSGLGGAASNAAVVLKTLAQIYKIACCPSSQNKMEIGAGHNSAVCSLYPLAANIGMDCAFFINGGTALATHFGEKIEQLLALPSTIHFEYIDTGVSISTPQAYSSLDLSRCGKNITKTDALISLLRKNAIWSSADFEAFFSYLHNDFEESIFARHPELTIFKKSHRVLLSGSGGGLVACEEKYSRNSIP